MDKRYRVIERIVSATGMDLRFDSPSRQMINIRVQCFSNRNKVSKWEVLEVGSSQVRIDLSSLPTGLYKITVNSENGKTFAENFIRY